MTDFTLANVCGLTEETVPYGIFDSQEAAEAAMVSIVTHAGTVPGRFFRENMRGDIEVLNAHQFIISTWTVRPTNDADRELLDFLSGSDD